MSEEKVSIIIPHYNHHSLLEESVKSIIAQSYHDIEIIIIDDGIGMSRQDSIKCFEKHSTSKLKKSNDLFKIKTMGFRGEALSSIASVCQVEMSTKMKESETGTKVLIEGSKK